MALSLEGWGRQYSDMIKEREGGRKNFNGGGLGQTEGNNTKIRLGENLRVLSLII